MDESEGGFLLYSENIEPPIPTIVILKSLDYLDSSVIIQTVSRLPGFGNPTKKRAVPLTYAMFREHFIWFIKILISVFIQVKKSKRFRSQLR